MFKNKSKRKLFTGILSFAAPTGMCTGTISLNEMISKLSLVAGRLTYDMVLIETIALIKNFTKKTRSFSNNKGQCLFFVVFHITHSASLAHWINFNIFFFYLLSLTWNNISSRKVYVFKQTLNALLFLPHNIAAYTRK